MQSPSRHFNLPRALVVCLAMIPVLLLIRILFVKFCRRQQLLPLRLAELESNSNLHIG